MQHLLDGDAAELLAPPVDGVGLLGGQAIADTVLEAELCEQVLAHDHVLELQRLGQQPPQVLPVRDDDLGLGHGPQFTRSLCRVPRPAPGMGRPSPQVMADFAHEHDVMFVIYCRVKSRFDLRHTDTTEGEVDVTTSTSRGRRRLATLALALGLVARHGRRRRTRRRRPDEPVRARPGPDRRRASRPAAGSFATSQTTRLLAAAPGLRRRHHLLPDHHQPTGTFGAVAISPGFTATQSSIAWLGPRLASQGFVVITIDTNSVFDQPASRGTQLLAALDYLTQQQLGPHPHRRRPGWRSPGHSMGGGGTLEAATDPPVAAGRDPARSRGTPTRRWSESACRR